MPQKKPEIAIGESDFREIRSPGHLLFVDKSAFIEEVIEDSSKVLLITRPRRFGKTLNMSMLEYFFSNQNLDSNRELFRGLQIFNKPDLMKHQGSRPVIFLSFKECKDTQWDRALAMFQSMISSAAGKILSCIEPSDELRIEYETLLKIRNHEASLTQLTDSLALLCQLLCGPDGQGEKPLILIDEYDVPLRSAWSNDYFKEAVNFMGKFFSAALKDCKYVWKSVLTGCMRISKESIFTDLNNLSVYGVSAHQYADHFGFTTEDVDSLLCLYEMQEHKEEIQKWYDGYRFGDTTIFNPWSILNWLHSGRAEFRPYWVNTSGNELVHSILQKAARSRKPQLETLLAGDTIKVPLQEHLVYADLDTEPDCIWNFLYVTGYLKAVSIEYGQTEMNIELKIPNRELAMVFHGTIKKWFARGSGEIELSTLGEELRTGNLEDFEVNFKYLVLKSFSYFDLGTGEPENFYHAFILGLLVNFQSVWDIRSNREAGYGRADLIMTPKKPEEDYGVVIEFKADRGEGLDLKELAQKALDQVEKRQYEQELKNAGAQKILKMGIAFQGKAVEIVSG